MRINDLPSDSRPREKALKRGLRSLGDAEILALFIGSGHQEMNALDLANMLLKKHGSIEAVSKLYKEQLVIEKGISEVKALQLMALGEVIRRMRETNYQIDKVGVYCYQQIADRFTYELLDAKQEKILVVILNTKFEIVKEISVYHGNEGGFEVSPNAIIKLLILHNAQTFVLLHNHPSGQAEPSLDDISFTINFRRECQRFGLRLLDHIILARRGVFSFANSGYWETRADK